MGTAGRSAALFEQVDRSADLRTAPPGRRWPAAPPTRTTAGRRIGC